MKNIIKDLKTQTKTKYKRIKFLIKFTGGESSGRQTRQGVAVCSQRRALLVAGIVLGSLLLTALIIAYAGPQNGRLKTDLCVCVCVWVCDLACGYLKYVCGI